MRFSSSERERVPLRSHRLCEAAPLPAIDSVGSSAARRLPLTRSAPLPPARRLIRVKRALTSAKRGTDLKAIKSAVEQARYKHGRPPTRHSLLLPLLSSAPPRRQQHLILVAVPGSGG